MPRIPCNAWLVNLRLGEFWRLIRSSCGDGQNNIQALQEAYFDNYFGDKETAYAIKIKKATRYDRPLALKHLCPISPPTSIIHVSTPRRLRLVIVP